MNEEEDDECRSHLKKIYKENNGNRKQSINKKPLENSDNQKKYISDEAEYTK